jgi:hypothetical protein
MSIAALATASPRASISGSATDAGGVGLQYDLLSLGYGPSCTLPSATTAQLLRSAVLAVPSVEWLADVLTPGMGEAVAAADAAGLRSLPLAPLVGSDELVVVAAGTGPLATSRDAPPASPHLTDSGRIQHGASSRASAAAAAPAKRADDAAAVHTASSFTARFASAIGGLVGGGGAKLQSPAEVRAALAKAERCVSVHAQDLSAAYGLLPVFQVWGVPIGVGCTHWCGVYPLVRGVPAWRALSASTTVSHTLCVCLLVADPARAAPSSERCRRP